MVWTPHRTGRRVPGLCASVPLHQMPPGTADKFVCAASLFRGTGARGDFNNVVEQGTIDLLEPMRHAVRHDNHIAFGDATTFTALDFLSANFIRGNGSWFGG